MDQKNIKVCVTGGAGYLASSLVKKLLEKGYTVHATLRNLEDTTKVGLLGGFPYAEERLVLFQADIYNPDEFSAAIQECEVVFHMATPFQHYSHHSQYKNTSEAAVGGVRSIVESCIKAGTVKRIVYTASVMAASPLKDGGSAYKYSMDESCWSPPNLSLPLTIDDFIEAYTQSKTLAEKEVLRYNGEDVVVVSLACGLVGGDTLLPYLPASMVALMSQYLKDEKRYGYLRSLEDLVGKVPIAHVEDITEAHIFCMENSATNGRYLCASDYLSSTEIAVCLEKSQLDIRIPDRFKEDTRRNIKWGSRKLEELGFKYQHDAESILNGSVQCAMRLSNSK